ncbi:Gfo/Idh/MocA family oxidoreductase [Jeotgalibaca sp. MA1X17-3]|uniref:Gfo/Idh/MocA family protein n=1 Tax=Jeotgalibaca sp. MA1X17-3 TaxID=2908211 RepID=UPI001F19593D|nr:Gfo/Idh/MocA family oxidoreductase [Jeotgalibaca sp. MA1X17-3]UJF16451.1 Gfo/Idh/MocA family oxidoreductase [Jeotgalibaca sp. MA1X17-3]
MKILNYGIISSASIVPRFVAALKESNHSQAVAIGASNLSKAQKMANELGIKKAYGSYKEVYEDPQVDVVYIATINDQHFLQIMEALSHQKHVVCEKPMVLQAAHATEAFAYAKKQGLFLMEAQKAVFLPSINYVKEKIKDEEFGRLRQATLNASWLVNHPKSHWMYDRHQAGVLFSSASYIIEPLLYLLDMPKFEYKALYHLGSKKEIDDATISFSFNNDLLVSSQLSMIVQTNNEANFYFDDAKITIKKFWSSNQVTIDHHKTGESKTVTYDEVPEMVYEINHVSDCIHKGLIQSPIMSEKMTETCVRLVEEIYQKSLES